MPESKSSPAPSPATEPVNMTPPSATQSFAPPLFPTPMFPYFSPVGGTPMAPKDMSATTQGEGRDELVEAGAVLALLKLVFG